MKIYGVALLAICFLMGKLMGLFLGQVSGIGGDIGGVGFAIILLMVSSLYLRKKGLLAQETERGITFWSAMYIPIIVAMAASQNVKAALNGGVVAILAGGVATLIGLLLVPLISKIGIRKDKN